MLLPYLAVSLSLYPFTARGPLPRLPARFLLAYFLSNISQNITAFIEIESKVKMQQAANSANIANSDASMAYIHGQVTQANEMTERYARALNDLNASYQILKGDQVKLQEKLGGCQAALKQAKNGNADLALQLEEAGAR